jgi:hypothetical protein
METETINAVGHIIEKFGFPIFVALCALVFFWQMFSYMKATVTKKDSDFLDYIQSANKQLADYVANRDTQINLIMDKHNEAFKDNSHALTRLSDSIELRINRDIRKERKETDGDITVA